MFAQFVYLFVVLGLTQAQFPTSMFGPTRGNPMFGWNAPPAPAFPPQPPPQQGFGVPQPPEQQGYGVPQPPEQQGYGVPQPPGQQGYGAPIPPAASNPSGGEAGSAASSNPEALWGLGTMQFKNFSSATASASNSSKGFSEKSSRIQELGKDGTWEQARARSIKTNEETAASRDFDKFDGMKLRKVNNGTAISEDKEVLAEESRQQSDSKIIGGEQLAVDNKAIKAKEKDESSASSSGKDSTLSKSKGQDESSTSDADHTSTKNKGHDDGGSASSSGTGRAVSSSKGQDESSGTDHESSKSKAHDENSSSGYSGASSKSKDHEDSSSSSSAHHGSSKSKVNDENSASGYSGMGSSSSKSKGHEDSSATSSGTDTASSKSKGQDENSASGYAGSGTDSHSSKSKGHDDSGSGNKPTTCKPEDKDKVVEKHH